MSSGLELIDLRRRFGDVVALDGVSLDVDEGSMVGFVGPNGAGKTTAMRIALGVLAADAGEVRWRGRVVDGAARRRFGYIPEERGLYPKMRVLDQLVYLARLHGVGRAAARSRAQEILEILGVAPRSNDRVETLSLGNQQRVQLAARWCTSRTSSSWTSRSRDSIRSVPTSSSRSWITNGGRVVCRSCSPATNWSWWSGCAIGSR